MQKLNLKNLKSVLFCLLAALLIPVMVSAGSIRDMDRWLQDRLYQHTDMLLNDIVIVGIDEVALEKYGPYNTWDRNIIASALEALAIDPAHLPAAVALDVLYSGSSFSEADVRLANAASRLGCVITASLAVYGQSAEQKYGSSAFEIHPTVTEYYEPYKQLKYTTVQGHINAMTDTDGVLRHGVLYVDVPDGRRIYSMAYEAASAYCREKGIALTVPEPETGYFYIPFSSEAGGYDDGISIASVIEGEIPPEFWAGKIVLIGPWATALQDEYFTSIDKSKPMYGVEIQANIIQCLLEGHYKTEVNNLLQVAVLFAFCFVFAVAFLVLSVPKGGVACAGLILLSIGCSQLLYLLGFVIHPLWIPFSVFCLYIFALAVHYIESSIVRRKLELEKERIHTELELAARIQESALIKEFPAFPDREEFDLRAYMKPAREVGGDLYDFFMPDDDHLMMVIADVSGKGIPASLFMMTTMTLLRHVAMREKSPARTLETVNSEMCARNPEQMFVTVWLGMLELSTGRLICSNAGHEYPALKKPGGSFELFKDRHGFVIGGVDGMKYKEYELVLEKGSKLFVYSDGVPEASNLQKEMFGTDRLIEALRQAEQGTPEDLISSVSSAVGQFADNEPQFDDITMLSLVYNGSSVKNS